MVVVDAVAGQVDAGTTVVIVGETGAGKSMLARVLVGLLPESAQVAGHALLDDVDLCLLRERQWQQVRGRQVGYLPQSPAFGPTRTLGAQIRAFNPALDLVAAAARVRLPHELLGRFPWEVSGGELRRAALLAATCHSPRLLVCDEPTAGLAAEDVTALVTVLDERRTRAEASLVVTHDLDFAERVADEIWVMRSGQIIDRGDPMLFDTATHPYTRTLAGARPSNGYRLTEAAV